MQVLVTGASGFVGSHIVEAAGEWRQRFGAEIVLPAVDLNLTDDRSVECALTDARFDAVLHLAAQSNVPSSFADPIATYQVNVVGTVRLLRALERAGFRGRFLYVSSGDVYGVVQAEDLPVTEAVVPRPANPYAASKIAAEAASLAWGRRPGGFEVIVARPFNHLGARQSATFAVARFASTISAMLRSGGPFELTTGRLDVTRDFLDVRDVIAAYFALLRKGHPNEIYNICSGVERSLADVLAELIGLSALGIKTTIDPALLRPVDLPRMVGSSRKLQADTGWRAQIAFTRTLSDLFDSYLHQTP